MKRLHKKIERELQRLQQDDTLTQKVKSRYHRILQQGILSLDKQYLTLDDLMQMSASDPTGRMRYMRWMVDIFRRTERSIFLEDLYKIQESLEIYEKVKHTLDIEHRNILEFNNYNDLWDLVKKYKAEPEVLLSKRQKRGDSAVTGEYDILLENDRYSVIVPITHRAACYWGSNTRWCTAHDKYSGNFETYAHRGPLVIVYHHDISEKKNIQFHIETMQFMDVEDRPINVNEFFKTYPDVLEVFCQYIKDRRYVPLNPHPLSFYQKKFIESLRSKNVHMSKIYLAYGASVNGIEATSLSEVPLVDAIFSGNEDDAISMIKLLIEYGAKIDLTSQNFAGISHIIASTGFVKILDILIKHGIDIHETNIFGQTPLFIAIQCQKIEMAKRLYELGADPDAVDNFGVTPRQLASTIRSKIKFK